jgi:2'-5' RNA ligase
MKLEEIMEKKNEPKGTYAGYRYDQDGVKLISKYAKDNDIPEPLDPKKMHTTLLYSKKRCPDYEPLGKLETPLTAKLNELEVWKTQAGKNALVVNMTCAGMTKRHKTLMKEHDAQYDFDEYKVHITLSYDVGDLDVDKLPDIRDTIKEIDAIEEYGEDIKAEWNK